MAISGTSDYQQLLRSVAEELKLPLLQIARTAELGYLSGGAGTVNKHLKNIEEGADAAIRLLDSYLLGLQLVDGQQILALEPVSLASIMVDSAHQLSITAKQYGVKLELAFSGRQKLIMGNARALQAAFTSLGSSIIVSQPHSEKDSVVTMAAYPGKNRMIGGIFGAQQTMTNKAWERSRLLYGRSRQPVVNVSSSTATGIFVADKIFQAMSANLHPSKHLNCSGLAASLNLSSQLHFV